MDMSEFAELVRSDRYASHLGIELIKVEEGHAVTRMNVAESHTNFLGSVHGGAIFSLADVAFSAAANSCGRKTVAIHIAIDYLAPPGDTPYLEADVRETARAGRAGHYAMEIRNAAGDTVAVCHAWAYHTNRDFGAGG
jgi:acyl-CoA thioesterase